MEAGSSKRKVSDCICDDSGTDRLNRNWKRSMMRILKGSAMCERHEACPASGCQRVSRSHVPYVCTKHIKCMMGDVTVSQWAPWKHVGSPARGIILLHQKFLGMDSDMGKVWKPTLMEGDQASWAIAHMLGDLVEVQEGIWMEMNISGTHQNELRAGWRIG